jgi:hypothetical protein
MAVMEIRGMSDEELDSYRTSSTTLPEIPFKLWARFGQRVAAERLRLGGPLTQRAVLLDLIRQYADGVTWFGRRVQLEPGSGKSLNATGKI